MAHDAAHAEHSHSTRGYWITAAILAVLTACEVAIFVLQVELEIIQLATWLFITILLVLSFAKGFLVVSMFMHLRGDAGIFKFLFIAPFILASAMIIGFLLIYAQPHVGIAG
jgi:cytochrome c oxidase subunit IV